jgi:hypothetical protein
MFAQRKRTFLSLIWLFSTFFFAITVNAVAEDQKESYTAFVINKSRTALNNSATVRITIERWTTDEERAALLNVLANEGHDGFVKVLHSQKETGFVRSQAASDTVGGLPRIVTRFARKITENGKTVITLVTDRPMRGKEDPDYKKFNVSALRFELPEDGKGSGIVYVALKVGYDETKKQLVLQSATIEPVHLTNVHLQK